MAKLTVRQWLRMREAYEVSCASAYELSKKYRVAESTISRRIKKHGWNRDKTQEVIEKKVNAEKAFNELTQENASFAQVIEREVDRRLRLDDVFLDSLEMNQKIADYLIKKSVKDKTIDLAQVDTHSKIVNRNKDGVSGKVAYEKKAVENAEKLVIEVNQIG